MNVGLIAKVLWTRRRLAAHEKWPRERLVAFQRERLAGLLAFARAHSPFYARLHRGYERAPLHELPTVRKADLMACFEDVLTERRIRLADVRAHLDASSGREKYLGRYRVVRTAGSTGEPAILLASPAEWTATIASYERAQRWAGIRATLAKRTRLAVVSSRVPWHQSAQVGLSVDSAIVPVRRFDAKQPLAEIVRGLNAWQPENLIAYASMARELAGEQLARRLVISPRAVMCASEPLHAEARARIERAWGVQPFDVYAATEPSGIASECARHRLHLYEDLVIAEIVDDQNRPVPPGEHGAKVLVTVLFAHTQPLIRYELSDSVLATDERCDCGLPFALIGGIQGRSEEVIHLGDAEIHPNVFHEVLEVAPVRAWQVTQEPTLVRVRVVPLAGLDEAVLGRAIESALRRAGAHEPEVLVERVEEIPKTPLGKAPLIRALPVTVPVTSHRAIGA
jgi:phenylacetate-coenzyme A ligase PaaK-like adenylate-forming protein